jgi:Tfp pilus assembly protein PilV
MEQVAWVVLGVIVGGAAGYILGYVRAVEEAEAQIHFLQLEWEMMVRLMQKEDDA